MSKLERKEYQETKIMRTVSPVRTTHSSAQNLSQFDSNLDYLLEDLQNSVSRPGSSLAQNAYRETSRSTNAVDVSNRANSLSRITKTNPVEYSSDDAYNYTSPDGRERVTGYKKEKYIYKTSTNGDAYPEKSRMQNSINQLDTLLDDLQQAKKSTFSETYNSSGSDPNFQTASKKMVNRELHYGDTPRPSGRSKTLERTEREEKRDYHYGDEVDYTQRTTSPVPSSRSSTLTKQARVKNIHEYPLEVVETPGIEPEVLAHLDPNLRPPGNTKVTTTIKTYTYEIPGSGDYPTNLGSPSDADKHVYSPNQSITTPSKSFVFNKIENKENTVYQQEPAYQTRLDKHYKESVTDNTTYNHPPYQKPAPPGFVVKETVTTRNYQPGYSPEINPPTSQQTYVYNENTTTRNLHQNDATGGSSNVDNTTYNYPPYQKPPPPGFVVKETVTTRNYQPGYNPEVNPPTAQQTYVYNENTTTRNLHQNGYPAPPPPRPNTYILKETTINKNETYPQPQYAPPPPAKETYILKEAHNTTVNRNEPQLPFNERGYPVYNPPDGRGNPPNTTYIIKETHNTTNRTVGPPPPNNYPNEPGKPTVVYKHETHSTNNTYGPGKPSSPKTPPDVESFDINKYGKPKEPINIHYSYKTTNTTQNSFKGGYPPNDESQPLLPQKFPTDDGPDGPPKRLDDLMATIGNEPPNSPLNAGYNAHEQERAQQKKIDTLKKQSADANDTQKKEVVSKSKNVTGPPVYYPPGHEMFAKKEESEAAWRAQGGYAKASGKYEYEAESKSKSKSSGGAAVIPVCLPLCCGLPCTLL